MPSKTLTLLVVIATALIVAAVHAPRYLPFKDYPRHVQKVALYSSDDAVLRADYTFEPWRSPYSTHLLPLGWLGRFIGADFAYRLFVTLYVVLAPLALWRLIGRLGGDRWATLLAFPAIPNLCFYFGFTACAISLATLPLAALAFEAWAERPSRRRWIGLAATGPALFLIHPFGAIAWGLTLATLGTLWMLVARRARARTWVALGLAAAAPLGALFYGLGQMQPSLLDGARPEMVFETLSGRTHGFTRAFGAFTRSPLYFLGLLACATALAGHALFPRPGAEPATLDGLYGARYRVVFIVLFAAYWILPSDLSGFAIFSQRFLGAAFLILPVAVGGASILARPFERAALAAGALLIGAGLLHAMIAFDAESKPLASVMAQIPERARVRCEIRDRSSAVFLHEAYRHFCAYLVVERSAFEGGVLDHDGVGLRAGAREERFEWLLVRDRRVRATEGPFIEVATEPPWHLYRLSGSP